MSWDNAISRISFNKKLIFSTLMGTKGVIPFLYSTVIFGQFEQNMNLKQNLNKVWICEKSFGQVYFVNAFE